MQFKSYFSDFSSVLNRCEAKDDFGSIPFEEAMNKLLSVIQKKSLLNKKILLVGNGGSATIASHLAVDFWKRGKIKATTFNDPASLTCISNDFSYAESFSKPIEMFADEGDVLFAISSSGKSPNILNAVDAAKKKNCFTVALSGFSKNNPLNYKGNLNFYLPTRSYGIAEIGHSLLMHYIIDRYLEEKDLLEEQNLEPNKLQPTC